MGPMKGDPIRTLRSEHKAILHRLDLLERAAAGPTVPKSGKVTTSVGSLESLVSKHFAFEESAVYVPLMASLGRDSPVDLMRREHRVLLRSLRELAAEFSLRGKDPGSTKLLLSSLHSFRKAFGQHVEKEEGVLFWLAYLKL